MIKTLYDTFHAPPSTSNASVQGVKQAVATAYQYPKFRNTVLFCHKSYFFPMIKNGLYLANFPQIFNVLYKIPSALVFKYNVLILRHQNWQN